MQCIQHFLLNCQLFNFNIYLQGMFHAKTGFFISIYCIYNERDFIQDDDTFKYKIQYYWNKRSGLDIAGFFFRMSTQIKAEVRSTKAVTFRTSAVTWVRMRKRKPVISNTGKFFCFNNNVSNLYNNSVVEKINFMAYIFTLLMFRKPNKTTINKNKTTNLYRSTSFRFSFIFRYFKVFQVTRIVYI